MPCSSVKREEALYSSRIVLVFWNYYIVTYFHSTLLIVFNTELAPYNIAESVLAPIAIIFIVAIVIGVIYATLVSHTYLASFWETIYF